MMTAKRVPADGRYGIEPAELRDSSFGRNFGRRSDVVDEVRELISFLIHRDQGWQSFTASEYDARLQEIGASRQGDRAEKRCEVLINARLIESEGDRYYITKRLVDSCAAGVS